MATHSGAVTSGDAQYRLGFSTKLYYESVVKNNVIKTLQQYNCINIENDLSNNNGGTVYLYNQLRVSGKGVRGDADFYANSEQMQTNSRTLSIAKVTQSVNWYMKGTQTQQYTPFEYGQYVAEGISDWTRSMISAGLINQMAGNNAASITQPSLDATAFTGTDLLTVTANNAATAPTYWYEANLGGAVTTDAAVNSGNTLSIKDFQLAAQIITSQIAGRVTWQTFIGQRYLGVVFVSYTGMYQLANEATTLGQGPQFQEQIYAQLAGGGKVVADMQEFEIPTIPFKFVVVPDSWMPRGVTTSGLAETANTRRCVIVGHKAIDLAFGAGYKGAGADMVPGMSVELDTQHKKLNKIGYGISSALYGAKKAVSTGAGQGNTTGYDMATYVITHYSAT